MTPAEEAGSRLATAEAAGRRARGPPTPRERLAAVYHNFPGLRALILRRVRDPELAADILQDAAVTTLQKLDAGEVSRPENIGGYLYRVALNHLRNHARKDRSALSASDEVELLADPAMDPEWLAVGHPEWAAAARTVLREMPCARDREILVRSYLYDEDKEQICAELRLSDAHFHRVIYRARCRFRALLEGHGFRAGDFLAIATVGICLGIAAIGALGIGTAGAAPSVRSAPMASDGVHS